MGIYVASIISVDAILCQTESFDFMKFSLLMWTDSCWELMRRVKGIMAKLVVVFLGLLGDC